MQDLVGAWFGLTRYISNAMFPNVSRMPAVAGSVRGGGLCFKSMLSFGMLASRVVVFEQSVVLERVSL